MNEIMPNRIREDNATTPMRLSLLFLSWNCKLLSIDKTHCTQCIPTNNWIYCGLFHQPPTPLPFLCSFFLIAFDARQQHNIYSLPYCFLLLRCSIFLNTHPIPSECIILFGADKNWATLALDRDNFNAGNKSNSKQMSAKKKKHDRMTSEIDLFAANCFICRRR